MSEILIEGMSSQELLELSNKDLELLVFVGRPVVFHIGTAEVLAEITREGEVATIVLAHIDGGGEGVLRKIFHLTRQITQRLAVSRIDWVVSAVHCAEPNHKLRDVLFRLEFKIMELQDYGGAYVRSQEIRPRLSP